MNIGRSHRDTTVKLNEFVHSFFFSLFRSFVRSFLSFFSLSEHFIRCVAAICVCNIFLFDLPFFFTRRFAVCFNIILWLCSCCDHSRSVVFFLQTLARFSHTHPRSTKKKTEEKRDSVFHFQFISNAERFNGIVFYHLDWWSDSIERTNERK